MINLREECEGYYKIEAVKADGSRRLLADWFPNLILDAGLDRMGDNGDYLNNCQVGSGSTAPATTQTTLVSRVAATSTRQSDASVNSGTEPYFARRTITYQFAQGVATGVLSEVGVGWLTSGGLFSRALILDALGQPTTITVLADESLDVTYELRMYVWTAEVSGTVALNGSAYDIIQKSSRAASWVLSTNTSAVTSLSVEGYTGDISLSIAGTPTGYMGAGSITSAAYSNGSFSRTLNITAGLDQLNDPAGIGAVQLSAGWGYWQIGFTPNIMKTASDILTLQVRHSWGRKA